MERTGQLGLAFDGHFGPPFTTTLGVLMRRFGHLDNLELASTPRQRLRYWLAALFELFGLGALGWTLGTTIVELLSSATILRLLLVGLAIAMVAAWVRWRTWPIALYGLGVSIIVVTIGTPLLKHFLL